MKILLVDDEKLQLTRLESSVKEAMPEAEIHAFLRPGKALEAAKEHAFDIAFLDIEMPVLNGIQLAKKLKEILPKINIIFVTAYDSYALDSYALHASGYVLKPVNKDKILGEIANLRIPVPIERSKKIEVKCFGNFEVFYDGAPLNFSYSKSKEVFAYLIDREGSSVSINELNAVMWEEDHKSYLRNLIADIKSTLTAIGQEDVFIKRHSECFIDVNKVHCDAYEYKSGNPDAINLYRGEYMSQYSWAMFQMDWSI